MNRRASVYAVTLLAALLTGGCGGCRTEEGGTVEGARQALQRSVTFAEDELSSWPAEKREYWETYGIPRIKSAIEFLDTRRSLGSEVFLVHAVFRPLESNDYDPSGKADASLGFLWLEEGVNVEGIGLRAHLNGQQRDWRLPVFRGWTAFQRDLLKSSLLKPYGVSLVLGEEARVLEMPGHAPPHSAEIPRSILRDPDLEVYLYTSDGRLSQSVKPHVEAGVPKRSRSTAATKPTAGG